MTNSGNLDKCTETLMKQLQILSTRSETASNFDLGYLTKAMTEIVSLLMK